MTRWLLALLMVALAWTTPAAAQTPIGVRAETLLQALKAGKADAADFAPTFLAQVPIAQVDAIAAQLKTQNGAALGIASLTPRDATEADVVIDYEQATVRAQFAIEPAAPHRFIGLFITGTTRKGDSFQKIIAELEGLPGKTALLVKRLDAEPPLAAHNASVTMATGSTFKLFVLAALTGKIADRKRQWEDVVPLGPPSLPSGVTQDWPRGTPMTLQTLATQMISISDNTATDTLINLIGRPEIDMMRRAFGDTPGAVPLLTTLEAFSLKMPARAALRTRWTSGGLSDRRQVINEIEPSVEAIDRRALGGGPAFIETVEWPATMEEVGRVLAAFRPDESVRAAAPMQPQLAILAVNPAISADLRTRFAYVGYKGGSETGVIAMSWLLRTKGGEWFTVAGAWNNSAAPVDEPRFAALMTRAVTLVAARPPETPPKP
jgi:Beta-lactamase enzyme family